MALTKAPEELVDKSLTSELTITTADNTTQLTLKSTDADASAGPKLDLFRDSGSPADSDTLGKIRFLGDNDANSQLTYADIEARIVDASNGSEDGRIELSTVLAGSGSASRILMNSTETVINDDSKDLDFRIEGDSLANAFFVEGSTNYVGIGTNDPTTKLEIYDGSLMIHAPSATGNAWTYYKNSDRQWLVGLRGSSSDVLSFYDLTADVERARIDTSGFTLIGRTSASFGATTGIVFRPNNDSYVIANESPCLTLRRNTSNGDILQFYRDGTQVGYVSVTASATSYQSGSDYRLKDNVTYDWEALPRLAQLKPARFNFKVDPDSTVEGFLAHEAQAVVPNAVGGTYNETKDVSNVVLNAEGNVLEEGVTEDDWKAGKEGEKPQYAADTTWKAEHTEDVYQGIDHSKLVPLMVKAIQELEAKVKALEEA